MAVTYRDTGTTYRSTLVTYRGGTPNTTTPVVTVEVAFTNNPGDATLTWVDISAYVESGSTKRGRKTDLDRFEPGTAALTLINDSRVFDPTYTAGPYYGNLVPMKAIRITARWAGVTYPIFYGFVDSWPQTWGDGGFSSRVHLSCTDILKSLALADVTNTYPSEYTGSRVGRVLDDLGWPAANRSISTGQSLLASSTLTLAQGLGHLQQVNDSENGLIFAARNGTFTFVDRNTLILAVQDATLVWGDAVGEYPYESVALDPQDAFLYNDWTVSSSGLTSQNAQSAASITRYYKRSGSKSTLLSTTAQMSDLANFLVNRFSTPQNRVVGLTMNGLTASALPALLGREIGDKIRVNRRPPVGSVITQDSIIESIALSFSPDAWQFQFDLSPVDPLTGYWVMGDAAQSLVGISTTFSY